MSRIGKQAITIPENTDVSILENTVTVKGPKGELARSFHGDVSVSVENNAVSVKPNKKTQKAQALWGTWASHVSNMITGVTHGFTKKLVIEGVGYRAALSGNELSLSCGFSHPVLLSVPEGMTVVVEKNVITVSGVDKEKVGQFAATVRGVRPPEPYKGKGIRYEDEVVRRKQGKRAVT